MAGGGVAGVAVACVVGVGVGVGIDVVGVGVGVGGMVQLVGGLLAGLPAAAGDDVGGVGGVVTGAGQSMLIDPAGAVADGPGPDSFVVALVGAAPAVQAVPAAVDGSGTAQAAVPAIRDAPTAASTTRPTDAGAILGSSRRARRPGRPGSRVVTPMASTSIVQPASTQASSPAVTSRIS